MDLLGKNCLKAMWFAVLSWCVLLVLEQFLGSDFIFLESLLQSKCSKKCKVMAQMYVHCATMGVDNIDKKLYLCIFWDFVDNNN